MSQLIKDLEFLTGFLNLQCLILGSSKCWFLLSFLISNDFPSNFHILLPETKVFSSSVPRKNPLYRAVLPIFRASTCPWDNRNRFVSKEIVKNKKKWEKIGFSRCSLCRLAVWNHLIWKYFQWLLLADNSLGRLVQHRETKIGREWDWKQTNLI